MDLGDDGYLDFDLARLELGAGRGEVVLVEVVLERERLESALVDAAALLGFVEERLNRCFQNRQWVTSFRLERRRRRSNLSIRLPTRAERSTPVYAGWQLEQTSTTSSGRVERVVNVLPHEVHRTVASVSSGCTCFR